MEIEYTCRTRPSYERITSYVNTRGMGEEYEAKVKKLVTEARLPDILDKHDDTEREPRVEYTLRITDDGRVIHNIRADDMTMPPSAYALIGWLDAQEREVTHEPPLSRR